MDLSTVARREKLRPRREPYWQRLASKQAIGFRPSALGKSGTWIARFYDADQGRKLLHSLGDFGGLPANERFGAAVKEARNWLEHVAGGGSHKPVTVAEACRRYAQDDADAATRFDRYVYEDPIADIPLHKLTDRHVRAWRKRLEELPALVTRNKGGEQRTRKRAPATLNRDMVPFRAALNLALEQGDALTSRAWKAALKPVEANGRRNLYLDRHQRQVLLEHLPADARTLVRGMCLLPLRPGALAALRAGDFDSRLGELVIGRDKAGGGRGILLPSLTAAFLREQCRDKLPLALMFTREDGQRWNKDGWKGPIKDAVHAAGLPGTASAYTIRHSTITDLVVSGLDLFTVAKVSGTSIRMIEKHYGHLQGRRAADALATLAL